MSENYAPDRLDAAKEIRAAGKLVTLRIPGASSVDPVTGVETAEDPTDYTLHAIEESQNAITLWNQSNLDGSLIQTGDRFFMLAALDDSGVVIPAPLTTDGFYVGDVATGTLLSIKGVRALQPGDIAIYYEVQCRG